MPHRYVITRRSTGTRAALHLPGLELTGEPGLCQELRPFLRGPVMVVGGRSDAATGRHSTIAKELSPGSLPWVEECLQRASVELGLDLAEVWW